MSKVATLVRDATNPVATAADLVVYGLDGSPRLAWNVVVEFESASGNALGAIVDGTTGSVITAYNAGRKFLQGSGGGVRFYGEPDPSDVKTFEVTEKSTKDSTSYTMARSAQSDRTAIEVRGCVKDEYDPKTCGRFPLISSSSLTSGWDDTGDSAGQAVDAAYHLALVDTYYRTKHSRASYDGKGSKITAIVHEARAQDNAAWIGGGKFAFGDMSLLKPRLSFAGSLDSVAHEFQHAVTGSTLKLAYQDQSGAIDEGLSNIFGMLVEHEFAPGADNFKGAEESANGAGPLEAYDDPASIRAPDGKIPPDHMSKRQTDDDDFGGVHINSSIVSHTWYLVIAGGKNKTSGVDVPFPIGWDSAGRLLYSVIVGGGVSPTGTFADLARATIASAKSLPNNGDEPDGPVNTVSCAWFATGVLSEAEIKGNWKADCAIHKSCFGGEIACPSGTICSWNGGAKGYCCRKPFTGTVSCASDEECADAGTDGICAVGANDKFWCTTVDSPACENADAGR